MGNFFQAEISMQSLSIEKLKTDVLVIGAGAGGMMAAISAADEGVGVTLCENAYKGTLFPKRFMT